MGSDPQTERIETVADHASPDRAAVPREWQFSLRSLLLATTVVSICLAIGTYFAGVAFAVFVLVLLQVAMLFSVDWLIRPANRRMLAFVAAGSWIIRKRGAADQFLARLRSNLNRRQKCVLGSDHVDFARRPTLLLSLHRWKRLSAQRRGNL
jgi:hypothetical protein